MMQARGTPRASPAWRARRDREPGAKSRPPAGLRSASPEGICEPVPAASRAARTRHSGRESSVHRPRLVTRATRAPSRLRGGVPPPVCVKRHAGPEAARKKCRPGAAAPPRSPAGSGSRAILPSASPATPRAQVVRGSRNPQEPAIPSERYSLAKSVFLSALARPQPERGAWIAEECRGDDALRREVEQLLRHHVALVGEGPAEPAQIEPAPVALGPFRILGTIGGGGMGIVYRAAREGGKPVALKVLRPGLLTPELLARFRQEAAALSRLDHPGIARIQESGLLEAPQGLQPYFAMDLVDGTDLRRWAQVPRSAEDRLELLARACDAVHHAHGQGVVHRDLKPENILVRPDGSPCVLDFGVARLTESDYRASTLATGTGVLVGTLRYMSPEQADARPGAGGPRSDVYSLGVLAYELLAGSPPYDLPTHSLHGALVAVLTAAPRPLPALPGLSGPRRRALEAVLGQALAKDPDRRYASAAALADDLRRVAAGRRTSARPARRGLAPRRWIPLLAGALVLAFAGGHWLGGMEWFRTGAPVLGRSDLRVRRAIQLLDSAAVRIHAIDGPPERVQAGIDLCDRARAMLGPAPRRAREAFVERLAWTLSMEAHLQLAQAYLEPGELEACISAGEAARRLEPDLAAGEAMPPLSGALLEHLADVRFHEPLGVMALAASRLGVYSQPVTMQARALEWNAQALARLDARPARVDDLVDAAPMAAALTRSALLSERSVMLARMGSLADSAALAREALRVLDTATARAGGGVGADASTLLRSGFAWGIVGRLEASPAAFDSAIARLRRALAAGRALRSRPMAFESRLALVEALRFAARVRERPELARRDLEAARAEAAGAAAGEGARSPRHAGLARLGRAAVELDFAAIERAPARAESALAMLADLDSLFTPVTHPVVYSDVQFERGRGNALLWALTGDRFLREAARRRLELAGSAVPGDEAPARARRLRAGLADLAGVPHRPPDLSYPVPSVSPPPTARRSSPAGPPR